MKLDDQVPEEYFIRGEDEQGGRGFLCAVYEYPSLKPRYFLEPNLRFIDERVIRAKREEIPYYVDEAEEQGIEVLGWIRRSYPRRRYSGL